MQVRCNTALCRVSECLQVVLLGGPHTVSSFPCSLWVGPLSVGVTQAFKFNIQVNQG